MPEVEKRSGVHSKIEVEVFALIARTFLKYGKRPSQLHSDLGPKYDPQRS